MLASTLPDFLVFLIFFLKFGRSLIFEPRLIISSEQSKSRAQPQNYAESRPTMAKKKQA